MTGSLKTIVRSLTLRIREYEGEGRGVRGEKTPRSSVAGGLFCMLAMPVSLSLLGIRGHGQLLSCFSGVEMHRGVMDYTTASRNVDFTDWMMLMSLRQSSLC